MVLYWPEGQRYPASAKHPLSAAVPVALPVPELEGHAEHVAEPVSALKVFAAHAIGVPPFEPVYPLSVTQAVAAVEPRMPPVAELGGQPVHPASAGAAALPVAVLKWSAKQAVKGPPSGPVYTAFATHAVPAVEPVKPPVDELVGQRPEHTAAPVSALNWSAKQETILPTHATFTLNPVSPLGHTEKSFHELPPSVQASSFSPALHLPTFTAATPNVVVL